MKDLKTIDAELAKAKAAFEKLESERKQIMDAQRSEVLTELKKTISDYSFTARELGLSSGSKSVRVPKVKKSVTFRHSDGREWDGDLDQRGRKPAWIVDAIKDGTIENYRVK